MAIKLLAVQRRTYEIGRIRIGVQVPIPNKPGKTRPAKLGVFRFTSRDEHAIRAIADLYGGDPHQWTGAPTDDQWEVITTAREIDGTVPPGPQAVSQWMEMWTGGGCARRCDGEVEQQSGSPCLCPSDQRQRSALAQSGQACKPTTRVSLVLRDIPGLGVWRIDSHGWNAAHELGGTAELLAAIREAGAWVPAVLRLEKRRAVSGGKTKEFVVPVLTTRQTINQLAIAPQNGLTALPEPKNTLAIEASSGSAGQELPPESPEDLALLVEACASQQDLRGRLAAYANRREWMGEFVPSKYAKGEEWIELREVFRARDVELARPSAESLAVTS